MLDIPVAILIFDNNGILSYRAYSPTEYNFLPEGSNHDEEFGQFLAHLYNRIAYDQLNPINNATNYGNLKEIHTRYLQIPITERNNICYFSTYIHPHCNYKPVHHESPVFFDQTQANNYANIQTELCHRSCPHEFI